MNADHCTSDFYFTSVEQMQDCIAFWLFEYNKKMYVRLSVVSKEQNKAIGTVEIFGSDFPEIGRAGILRMDLYTAPQITNTKEKRLVRMEG